MQCVSLRDSFLAGLLALSQFLCCVCFHSESYVLVLHFMRMLQFICLFYINTFLKIFPGLFLRHEPCFSVFVHVSSCIYTRVYLEYLEVVTCTPEIIGPQSLKSTVWFLTLHPLWSALYGKCLCWFTLPKNISVFSETQSLLFLKTRFLSWLGIKFC